MGERRRPGILTTARAWFHLLRAYFYGRRGNSASGRRFAIVAPGRCGSHLLIDLLNSHPAIECHAEGRIFRKGTRVHAPLIYLNGLAALAARPVYGCKITAGHVRRHRLDADLLVQQLVNAGWGLVLLSRRNLLRQAVSGIVARERGVYHDRGSPPAERVRVTVAPEQILGSLAALEAKQRLLARWVSPFPHVHLVYEDDLEPVDRHQPSIDRILSMLDLASHPVATDLVKTGTRDLSATIRNFGEVARALQGTRHERFLAM